MSVDTFRDCQELIFWVRFRMRYRHFKGWNQLTLTRVLNNEWKSNLFYLFYLGITKCKFLTVARLSQDENLHSQFLDALNFQLAEEGVIFSTLYCIYCYTVYTVIYCIYIFAIWWMIYKIDIELMIYISQYDLWNWILTKSHYVCLQWYSRFHFVFFRFRSVFQEVFLPSNSRVIAEGLILSRSQYIGWYW